MNFNDLRPKFNGFCTVLLIIIGMPAKRLRFYYEMLAWHLLSFVIVVSSSSEYSDERGRHNGCLVCATFYYNGFRKNGRMPIGEKKSRSTHS